MTSARPAGGRRRAENRHALDPVGFHHPAGTAELWDSFLRFPVPEFSYPDIRLLEVDHLVRYEDLVLITKKGRYLSRSIKSFLRFVEERIEQEGVLPTRVPAAAAKNEEDACGHS